MVNLLNLKKQPEPVIIERIIVKKRSFLLEIVKMLTIILVSSSVIYAVSRAAVVNTKVSPKTGPNTQRSLPTPQDRITKYKDFLANMPTDLSKADQVSLTTDINDAISTIEQNIDRAKSNKALTTSTVGANNLKKNTATSTRPFAMNKIASTTRTAIMEKQKKAYEVNKINNQKTSLLNAKIQALNQLFRPTATTSTSISPDLLHQIVSANSTSTIQTTLKQIRTTRAAEAKAQMEASKKANAEAKAQKLNTKSQKTKAPAFVSKMKVNKQNNLKGKNVKTHNILKQNVATTTATTTNSVTPTTTPEVIPTTSTTTPITDVITPTTEVATTTSTTTTTDVSTSTPEIPVTDQTPATTTVENTPESATTSSSTTE